jgi:hypothetical protein
MSDLDPDSASAQLRVIRSLMERATIYRSLSAPTALVGGLLSFGGLGVVYAAERWQGVPLSEGAFLAIWLVVLALTLLTNSIVLWREAQRRGQPFFSAGMKCALRSVLPPFLCAGFLTFTLGSIPEVEAVVWMLFYGLGLLAMQHFAPRSIIVLGWTFLLAAAVCGFAIPPLCGVWGTGVDDALLASGYMAMTFGLFHIVYAIAVWARGEERADTPLSTPTESGNV